MPWSKGAVVIVKHGDQEWADAIEQAMDIRKAADKEVKELQDVQNEIYKEYYTAYWGRKIRKARKKYGRKNHRTRIGKKLNDIRLLSLYKLGCFIEKYLIY